MALAVAALLAAGACGAASAGARGSGAERAVTVQPGENLWLLSRRFAAPGEDPRRWIFDVERLNGLRGAVVLAGQELRLPPVS